ncbi:translocation/assembly module TamB domain-containing protein [Alistipes sp.]|uniref:translocation/assembly module TamB domain-containing protein n=1 Tax=Alistipes sp. TaxID=1872444 RepID=UPI003AEF8BCF
MRKGIKILRKVFTAAVLLFVVLPLTLALLLHIPAVQNFVVRKAVRALSYKLETTVDIGRVDVGLLGKVRVSGLYVEDYQQDTLLYVGRLDAFVTGLGLFGGGVSLSRGEIADAKLYLRETPEGVMNIKQLIDRLSDPDKPKKGNFRLSLSNASIHDMDFCLERLKRRDPPFGIDFGHMHLYGLEARIDQLEIDGQAIAVDIATLSARERSGFVLDHLSGRFFLANGCIGFEQATLATEHSYLSIPSISLAGGSWADYKEFIGEVRIEATIRNSQLATDDAAYFAPRLRDWHTTLSRIDLEVSGEVEDLKGKINSLRVGRDTYLTADLAVEGLPDVRSARFDLNVPRLSTTASAADSLARSIARKPLPAKTVEMLSHAGRMDLSARFRGSLSAFDVDLGAETGVGTLACNVELKPLRKGFSSVRGAVSTRSLKLGELLGRSDLLGDATLAARINGVVGRGYADAKVVGSVSRLGFNGYVYDSLRLDGRLRNKEFDGLITARDPNLDFDFSGLVDFNDTVPRYDFTLALHHADLTRLHINRRDTLSQLSARLSANGSGRSLDDMNGRIRVTNVRYRYNDKELEADSLTVRGVNSARSKYLELRSDFADATFRSKTSYREVFEYLRQSAWKYLPMLDRRGRAESARQGGPSAADDYSLLSVDIRRFNPVADAVAPGLQIADGSLLRLLFNPASNKLSFRASSEYVERRRLLATRLNINASNQGDSLAVYASAEDLYAGALHLPHLSLTGGAKQGLVQLSAGFNDTLRKASGLLGLRAGIAREDGPNGRVLDVHILPSHITRGDKTWRIFARRIQIDTAQVVIDRFYVMNSGQELLLDGIASRSPEDSLTLRLRNFDLAPFSQVADRIGYGIEGRTSGEATMRAVLGSGEIAADILIDSLSVNGVGGPPLQLTSRWDPARNRAGVIVANRAKRDTLIRGFYAPRDKRYYARLSVDSLDMSLLDPVLSGVISSTQGLASADLTLRGQRRDADLSGRIRVQGLRTKVDFTQVTYSMPEAVLDVKGNRFRAKNVPIFDTEGNRGRFDFDMSLQHLSNITYDVRVAPEGMLVLNTTEQDNDAFYGKVFATGTARIAGGKGSVEMDIAATTDDNSSFFMPLSSKSNISNADFVIFEKPKTADSVDNLTLKKQAFERRRKERSTTGSRMNISLALNVQPNVDVELTVSGNTIRARGEGALNMQINPRSNVFEIYGDYTISDGSFLFSLQNILTRKFIIEPGSTIQWTGSPVNALLNIDAVYKVKASLQPLLQGTSDRLAADRSVPVECVIHLGDRLTDPAVTFDVRVPASDPETQTIIANALNTPETVDMQFLYLLLFKSFMAENSAASQNIGASVSYNTGLEFLANQLSSWLSADDYNIVIRYRPKSDITSDEVDFGLSKSLINNRLFVEVEGNYLIDNKQAVNSSMSNFMGEAYITYLIDRAGTLKLKAFTQTIDRFDENQGMQETGIGIYFKEDFNNFRDLRRRIKERFTNKKRQARRAARKAAAAEAAEAKGEIPPAEEATDSSR